VHHFDGWQTITAWIASLKLDSMTVAPLFGSFRLRMEPVVGIEPTTDGLQIHAKHCATTAQNRINAA